jgi:MoCo/4Fe-4S cofactor protein with predicted Tat translocation signal
MSSLNRPWRSVAEWEQDPAFLARAAQEFPGLAEALASPHSRRTALKLMAAAFAMGGLDGCDIGAPDGRLIPAVKAPPNIIPGLPNFYSTATVLDGFATGILVEHQMGRPVKVEGNPLHPASLGATDVFAQAQVLDFYDPDRSSAIALRRRPSDRQTFLSALTAQRQRVKETRGAGFRILTGTITSPTLAAQLDALLALYPEGRWHQWNPVSRDNCFKGAQLAFAEAVDLVPKLAAADLVLAIDSDLLSSAPGHLRCARELMSRRNPARQGAGGAQMNRIYAIEPTPTLVGAVADHRFMVGPRELPAIVAGLAAAVLQGAAASRAGELAGGTSSSGSAGLGSGSSSAPGSSSGLPAWVAKIASDLMTHPGRVLVHVGPDQPPEVHALAHAMNEKLGARGATFDLIEPVANAPEDQGLSLRDLVTDMRAGKVTTLLIIDSNPVFAAPGALGFAEALQRVGFSVALSPTPDETFSAATWAIPMTHPWETWGDARAFDGTATILQPQAMPLYGGFSAPQMLALFYDPSTEETLVDGLPDTMQLVQATWKQRFDADFPSRWHDALADGVVQGTAAGKANPTLRSESLIGIAAQIATSGARTADTATTENNGRAPSAVDTTTPTSHPPLTILFRPDPHIWDGRYANNAWLQELPRPLTKLTWDNPLLISPTLARKSNLRNGDQVQLAIGDLSVLAPVWILPGQAADCVVAPLGFGRRHTGNVAAGTGFDYYPLVGLQGTPTMEKTGHHVRLASTDHHNLIFNAAGDLIKHGTLAAYRENPGFLRAVEPGSRNRNPQQLGSQKGNPHELGSSAPAPKEAHLREPNPQAPDPKVPNAELYRWQPEGPAAWAMSIDLNACIGCNACVVACQSENNIPVVGKEQVIHEREMHWLRIDRYWEGQPDDPHTYFQPILCMHCEQAPCETVCPVGATVHDSEGLNVMVYNRCVGTRFCSNNCPYKVRRFNYYGYAKEERRPLEARNPDVSVRARGVMEKCTFCVQRIAEARIAADKENRPVGTVTTACQAACPTQAITFGNLRDPSSAVAKRKQSPLDYALLVEQNTHPRVTYEARIHNPGPELSDEGSDI